MAMADELDITLLPLYRINGQDASTLPGLQALTAPRRAARGRERDRLLVYLNLGGNAPLTPDDFSQLISKISDNFFQTAGSLTSALKAAIEATNTFLVERNMKTTGHGQYIMGTLVLGALRDSQLYIVQSGPTHALYLGENNAQHFHDPQLAGRGLGFSQTARIFYSHVEIHPGDRLVFALQMPGAWENTLTAEPRSSSNEIIRSRLMGEADENINGVLITLTRGVGQVTLLRAAVGTGAVQLAPASVDIPQPADEPPAEAPFPQPDESPLPTFAAAAAVSAATGEGSSLPPAYSPPSQTDPVQTAAPAMRRVITPLARKDRTKDFFRALAKSMTSMRFVGRKASSGVQTMATRVIPGGEDQPFAISPLMMGFIAVAVPVIIISVAAVVYMQFGRSEQYRRYYSSAEQAAVQAVSDSDPAKQRTNWETSLYWLDKADTYIVTDQSRSLRQQAQNSLDGLERIVRVTFNPAFANNLGSFPVTQMATNENDLYMLNAAEGKILRAIGTAAGYTLDPNFNCLSGYYDGIQVGALVDIVALPKNTYNATIMGMDATGNVIYCKPDSSPRVAPLAPPDTGWGTITAITYDANNLYVLDPTRRAVWVYVGSEGGFPDRPFYFFGDQVPALENAVDLAVSGDDLYLLNKDSHLTTCTLSRISASPTRCTDPAVLTDTRAGYTSGTTLPDAQFSQIQFTSPPNSTVSLLEPRAQAVYRFVPRTLELQDQLRSVPGKDNPLPPGQPVTAMTMGQNRTLFLFINGMVYYAENVP
jgi:hypothetical protein